MSGIWGFNALSTRAFRRPGCLTGKDTMVVSEPDRSDVTALQCDPTRGSILLRIIALKTFAAFGSLVLFTLGLLIVLAAILEGNFSNTELKPDLLQDYAPWASICIASPATLLVLSAHLRGLRVALINSGAAGCL